MILYNFNQSYKNHKYSCATEYKQKCDFWNLMRTAESQPCW